MLSAGTLTRVTFECVHFILPSEESPELRSTLTSNGYAIFEMSGSSVGTKEELLRSMATAMAFPGYFGMNWDAVEECLRDMAWIPASGYVVLFRQAERLWQDHTYLAGRLVETWLFSAQDWAKQNVPFHLVFVL